MLDQKQQCDVKPHSLKPISEKKSRRDNISILILAGLIHLEVLLIAFYIATNSRQSPEKDLIVTTEIISQEYAPIDLNKKRNVIKKTDDNEKVDDVPIVYAEEISDQQRTANKEEMLSAEGATDSISDSPLISNSLMGNIGGGGSSSGAFSQRNGSSKKKAVFRGGGSRQTESAVDAALNWLMRHQEKDGHWDIYKYGKNDTSLGFDRNKINGNVTLTGLATLAFLSAGNTPISGKYKETVKKAITWILNRQLPDGSFGSSYEFSVYDNAICALVLSELSGMCPEQKYKAVAQRTINYLVNIKKVHYGFSNHANIPKSTSVNGWLMMAFKSAKIAGLHLPPIVFDRMHKRLVEVTKVDTSGNYESVHYMDRHDRNDSNLTMTAVGMVMYEYLGVPRIELKGLADKLLKNLPAYGEIKFNQEMYHWYNTTLALFQYGGENWKIWNTAMSELLVKLQRTGGPLDGSKEDVTGSWDFDKDFWGQYFGRTYTTAMGALCLEVYYRYDSIFKEK